MARILIDSGVVASISPDTVRRILLRNDLRPWRVHSWLSPQVPRDEAFRRTVEEICDLYTCSLAEDEAVVCVDEKTNLQPRSRIAPTLAAARGQPQRIEHGYERGGAIHLLAAFDTRSGEVIHTTAPRKRAEEFITLLDSLDARLAPQLATVHVILDNLSMHKSKAVTAWLQDHPRFRFHFPPVHCSWLNQVEQWFSILQRKLLRHPNFADLDALSQAIAEFVERWNRSAHPFRWTSKSASKVMAKCSLSALPDPASIQVHDSA